MTKTKVSFVSTLPPTKAMSPYTLALVSRLVEKIDIDFVGFKKIYPERLYKDTTEDPTQTAPQFDGLKINNILAWYNPFSWIRAGFHFDSKIVHVQWWIYVLAPMYIVFMVIAKLRRKKIILTIHNVEPHEQNFVNNLANRSVYSLADSYIVHTESNKQALVTKYKKSTEDISVIPIGVEALSSKPAVTRQQARDKLGVPKRSQTILFFGHIRDYKGLDILIEAFSEFAKESPDARLIIAGKSWLDPKDIKTQIRRSGIEDKTITSFGFVPDADKDMYFMASDIVVLPYKYFDAQTAVASTVLPYGLPLLVSDVGELSNYVIDKSTSVHKAGDANDLADKLSQIFNTEGLLDKLKSDTSIITNKYSWTSIAEQTTEVYKSL